MVSGWARRGGASSSSGMVSVAQSSTPTTTASRNHVQRRRPRIIKGWNALGAVREGGRRRCDAVANMNITDKLEGGPPYVPMELALKTSRAADDGGDDGGVWRGGAEEGSAGVGASRALCVDA